MGNNMTCKVRGIGPIKVVLENGRILFLKGARFVPELERNLFSLEMLDDMEFDINLGQG